MSHSVSPSAWARASHTEAKCAEAPSQTAVMRSPGPCRCGTPVEMSKTGTLRTLRGRPPGREALGGEGWRGTGGGPESGWGCPVSELGGHLDIPTLKLPSRPGIHHWCFPLWSLDVTAGKNLTRKQMIGREMLMFWNLRKWLPWQQGARERTSVFMDSVRLGF